MQTMELVDIEDVYPYEDHDERMNPRDVTSRECREYIAQLAEQFKYNRLNPGQPRVRPILYKDGGIYQIIDGECRYEAMKLAGTKRFYADVFDDLDDAETARREAAKVMVETDAKRALTSEEMSRGVQQMLALDVPEEEVAAVARMDAGKVRRARRGAKAVADAAYDMTLDRLMAIAEFEDDPDAMAKLRDCTQRDWRGIYERLRVQRERDEILAELERICSGAGIERVPEGDETVRRCVRNIYLNGDAVEKLREAIESEHPTAYDIDMSWFELLRDETEEERAEDERERVARAEADRERQRARGLWEVEADTMLTWLSDRIGDLKTMRRTAVALSDRAMETVADVLSDMDAEVDMGPTPALCVVGWARTWMPDSWCAVELARGKVLPHQVYGDKPAQYVALADAMEADGYEFNEVGGAVNETLRKHVEEKNG